MIPRLPEVPRIGGNGPGGNQPTRVEIESVEVFYTGTDDRHEKFVYRAPTDNPQPRDMRAFAWVPDQGLDVERHDRTHVYVPATAVRKLVMTPAKVADVEAQITELLTGVDQAGTTEEEEDTDGSES